MSQEKPKYPGKQDCLSVYNVFLEASERAGDSSDLEDIMSSLNQLSIENQSFLSYCFEKIEKEAVFPEADSLPVKRQK